MGNKTIRFLGMETIHYLSSMLQLIEVFSFQILHIICVFPFCSDAPKLPKKRVIGRFKENFLWRRQEGLQKFLNRCVSMLTVKFQGCY